MRTPAQHARLLVILDALVGCYPALDVHHRVRVLSSDEVTALVVELVLMSPP